MQFITFPPRKIGQKIQVQNGLPCPHDNIDEYFGKCDDCGMEIVQPALPEDDEPRNNAVTDKSDLIVPGEQPKLAGRSWPALKESKTFDNQRLNESPLFKETGRLF